MPVIPSISSRKNVLPEPGYDAKATIGSFFAVLKTISCFSHCLSVDHGNTTLCLYEKDS